MAKFKSFRFRKGYRGRKKPMSATKKAYVAGLRRGKAIARARRSKRWY